MAQKTVQLVIGWLLTDEDLRLRFKERPEETLGELREQGYELTVVTAVILGGASLAGGRGSIFGTVIGLLIIGIIDNGLTLLNVQSFWQDVVRGTLLICAVGFDVMRRRLTEA